MTLYGHVSVVAPGMSLDRQQALAAAARSLGGSASVDAELRTARAELTTLDEPVPGLADARRRVAETEAVLEEKRERVATLRGRLQESGESGVAETYREEIRRLSEVETAHVAATEALEDARGRARRAWDARERRLRIEDRIDALERRAREELAAAIRPDVDEAVATTPGSEASSYEAADPVTAALALVRVGRVRPPIVLACRRFPDAPTAETWLGCPVHRL